MKWRISDESLYCSFASILGCVSRKRSISASTSGSRSANRAFLASCSCLMMLWATVRPRMPMKEAPCRTTACSPSGESENSVTALRPRSREPHGVRYGASADASHRWSFPPERTITRRPFAAPLVRVRVLSRKRCRRIEGGPRGTKWRPEARRRRCWSEVHGRPLQTAGLKIDSVAERLGTLGSENR